MAEDGCINSGIFENLDILGKVEFADVKFTGSSNIGTHPSTDILTINSRIKMPIADDVSPSKNTKVLVRQPDNTLRFEQKAEEVFKTIEVDNQSSIVANELADKFKLVPGNNMTIETDTTTNSITFSSSSGSNVQNIFKTIRIDGYNDLIPDTSIDVLKFAGKNNIDISASTTISSTNTYQAVIEYYNDLYTDTNNHNATLTLFDSNNVAVVFTMITSGTPTSTQFLKETDLDTTATNLSDAINNYSSFSSAIDTSNNRIIVTITSILGSITSNTENFPTGLVVNNFQQVNAEISTISIGLKDNKISGDLNIGDNISDLLLVNSTSSFINATTFENKVNINDNLQVDNINIDGNSIISTNTDGDINITPNGTGIVNLSKVDINSGIINDTDITVGSGKSLDLTQGTLELADDQISGDKIEGGTINSITINELGGSLDCNSQDMENINIINGTINNVSLGLTTPCTELQLDNINIDGNTISTTDIDGNLILQPNGNGEITTNSNITAQGTITGGTITGTSIVGTLTTVSQPNITEVGSLDGGSITTNFGDIDVGTSTITSNKLNSTTLKTNNIMESYDGETIEYIVTVASKTSEHPYSDSGSGNGYFIDGIESPFIEFVPGKTYKFDQSDGSNSGHPLRFYHESNKATSYTTGVTTNGTPGSSGAYTQIVVTTSTPRTLFYQCSAHSLMGNQVQIKGGAIESTGDLDSGSITSGFGNIDIGTSTITCQSIEGELTTASQANITSVGTLTSLTVNGDATINNSSGNNNILKVDTTNGFIGINKSIPTASLDINGNVKISGDLTIDSASNDNYRIAYLDNNTFKFIDPTSGSEDKALSLVDGILKWETFGSISSGSIDVYNLGILNTPLDADLYIGSDKNNLFVSNGVADFFQNVNIIDSTLHIESSSGETLSITSFETDNPVITSTNGKIDIESNNTNGTVLNINNTTNNGDSVIGFKVDGDDNQFTIGVDDSDNDKFKIGTTSIDTDTRLTIDSSGNVGIGTTNIQEKLTVNGNINTSGSLDLSGNASFGAQTRQMINLYNQDYGIGVQGSTTYFRTGGDFQFYEGGVHHDSQGNAGGGTKLLSISSTGQTTINGDLEVNGNIKGVDTNGIGLRMVPIGAIIMWNGSTVPYGWALCDGNNGTPNLRDRFIVGSGSSYSTGNTGGASSVTLQTTHLPSHNHNFSGNTHTSGNHAHSYNIANNRSGYPDGYNDTSNAGGYWRYGTVGTTTGQAGSHHHYFSGTTSSTGSNSAHENRPPYYALAFIMRIL